MKYIAVSAGVLLIGIIVGFSMYQLDKSRVDPVKQQLMSFFTIQLDSCKIISTRKIEYPGLGYYDAFLTDCDNTWLPVLFEGMTLEQKKLFIDKQIVRKDAKSRNVFLDGIDDDLSLRIVEISSLSTYEAYYLLGATTMLFLFVGLYLVHRSQIAQ